MFVTRQKQFSKSRISTTISVIWITFSLWNFHIFLLIKVIKILGTLIQVQYRRIWNIKPNVRSRKIQTDSQWPPPYCLSLSLCCLAIRQGSKAPLNIFPNPAVGIRDIYTRIAAFLWRTTHRKLTFSQLRDPFKSLPLIHPSPKKKMKEKHKIHITLVYLIVV